MSNPLIRESNSGRGSFVSHHLCAAKKELHNILLGTSVGTTLDENELVALDQVAAEVLSSIRSVRNRRAPINRLPWDVLALIPDFWNGHGKKKVAITLTHVCRTWREIFTSHASLWTDFNCIDAEKTRVYLERSVSAPINMWLEREQGLSPNDPFLDIPSHAIGRLKSLCITTTPDHLEDIAKHFLHPAPLLKTLEIDGGAASIHETVPVLPSALFGGDLSSLRELCLESVCTQLPWRNMNNLTSLTLDLLSRPTVSIGQILDFFESAPRLLEVTLFSSNPTSGAQDGRLVSLSRLRKLKTSGPQPPSLLLNHLVIPVGAEVTISSGSPDPHDLLPKSLDNLQNLSNFSGIDLEFGWPTSRMCFTGPNGKFCAISPLGPNPTRLVTRALERFDTSSTQCLDIVDDNCMTNELHEAMPSMKNLRNLNISRYTDSPSFLRDLDLALAPGGVIACPKLEELVPLQSVKVSPGEPISTAEVAELQEHVSHVEICFKDD